MTTIDRDSRIGKDEYCARECRHCQQPQIAFVRQVKSDDPWRCTGCGNPQRDTDDAMTATPITTLAVEQLRELETAAVSAVHEKPGNGGAAELQARQTRALEAVHGCDFGLNDLAVLDEHDDARARAHLQRITDAITRAGAQAVHPTADRGVDLSRVEMPASAWNAILRAVEGE